MDFNDNKITNARNVVDYYRYSHIQIERTHLKVNSIDCIYQRKTKKNQWLTINILRIFIDYESKIWIA